MHEVVKFSDAAVRPVLSQLGQNLTKHIGPGYRKEQGQHEKPSLLDGFISIASKASEETLKSCLIPTEEKN
jgi:hypothetical protein